MTNVPELGWDLLTEAEKSAIHAGMASGETPLPPRTVQIDWTDRCNIDCFFCSQADMRCGGGELPLDVLQRCFSEMEQLGVRTLNVAGGGDPLFHREILPILEDLRSRSFRIGTITTNAVLARGRVAELLLETTREQISVSLNALGAAAYAEQMRTTPRNYDRVLENIRGLTALRRERANVTARIAVQFLVHDDTYRMLPAMMELAEELGVDRVAFNPLQFFDDRSRRLAADAETFLADVEWLFRNDRRGIIADIRTVVPEINPRIEALRRRVAPGLYPIADRQQRNYGSLQSFCALPWFNLHVKATGDVYPCCALLDRGFRPFGNVHAQSLQAIWEGEAYRTFRQSHSGFTRAVRTGDTKTQWLSELPKPCTVHGMCFLRALPYLDDTPFAVSVDGLGRCHPQAEVHFPETMRDGEWAQLSGPVPANESASVEVFINKQHCGQAVHDRGAFSFGFQPEPLAEGFHLLEVRDGAGRVLAARMIEKLKAPEVG